MLDTLRVKSRVAEIRQRLIILEKRFKGVSESQLVEDENLNAAAEHHLQIAIQSCIDIANHIVAALGLERPSHQTGEAFMSLAKEGIITKEFAQTMVKITGYRNVLVHGYLEVDRHQTYFNIQNNLPDLSEFAKQIELFLEK